MLQRSSRCARSDQKGLPREGVGLGTVGERYIDGWEARRDGAVE